MFELSVNVCSIKQFVADNPQFTEKQIRNWMDRAADNGMAQAGAMVRCPGSGRRMIDVENFEKWLTKPKEEKKTRTFFHRMDCRPRVPARNLR